MRSKFIKLEEAQYGYSKAPFSQEHKQLMAAIWAIEPECFGVLQDVYNILYQHALQWDNPEIISYLSGLLCTGYNLINSGRMTPSGKVTFAPEACSYLTEFEQRWVEYSVAGGDIEARKSSNCF